MSTVTAVPLRAVNRRYLVYIWLGIAAFCLGALALARQGDDFLTRNARGAGVVTTASGLQYKVLAAGKPGAPRPAETDIALVSYEGRLANGTVFDRSRQPTPFPVAAGATVPGFSEGLKLMPKGAKYRFWMPPSLGYGAQSQGPIPANSTLVFDVELLDFLPEATVRAMQQLQQQQMSSGADVPPAGRDPNVR